VGWSELEKDFISGLRLRLPECSKERKERNHED
jgi:hypothetical protein